MKKITRSLTLLALSAPLLVSADSSGGLFGGETGNFGDFATGITDLINNFLIPLFIAIAVLGFIWGVFKYFILGSDDEEKRKEGRSLMLYAIIGFVAIVALWGIVEFVAGAFGAEIGEDLDDFSTGPSTGE